MENIETLELVPGEVYNISGDRVPIEAKGEIKTHTDILADVKNYAHSTFDASKFTVVGSPNITDDGIASGFSPMNYLKTNTAVPVDKDFIINIEYDITQDFLTKYESNTQYLLGGTYNSANDVVPILFEHTKVASKIVKYTLVLNNSGSNQAISLNSSSFDIALGDKIQAILIRKNGTYTAKYYKNGIQIGNDVIGSSTNNLIFESDLIIGQYKTNWANQAFTGSIDLKQFSITVDGVEVFSGNKTGIDTIYSHNYTEQGTGLTINDEVVSGFTTNDYLTYPAINVGADFEVITPVVKYSSFGSASQCMIDLDALSIRTNSSGVIDCWLYKENKTSSLQVVNTSSTIQLNKEYVFKAVLKNGTITIYQSENYGIDWTSIGTASVSGSLYFNNDSGMIGKRNVPNAEWIALYGTYDLRTCKIIVNGKTVYRPCLMIPYTWSKTGSKIVNSIYRDRVNDMANQFGYANYYTLQDEAKGNYQVVGSPTISSDFVASGFAGGTTADSKYVQANITQGSVSDIEFDLEFTTGSTLGQVLYIMDSKTNYNNSFWVNVRAENSVRFGLTYTDSSTVTCTSAVNLIQPNTTYKLKCKLSNNTLSMSINGGTPITANVSGTIRWFNKINLGLFEESSNSMLTPFNGSIDLKKFKVYVDNKLAYEAVTEPNFTLPQVELYGLIGQRTLRDSYRNGINYWELYSNRDLEQGGSCTSGVEVTFARPFADTNYVLSVPYSAKSSTAFTPTQTGDWIAKGKGVL